MSQKSNYIPKALWGTEELEMNSMNNLENSFFYKWSGHSEGWAKGSWQEEI